MMYWQSKVALVSAKEPANVPSCDTSQFPADTPRKSSRANFTMKPEPARTPAIWRVPMTVTMDFQYLPAGLGGSALVAGAGFFLVEEGSLTAILLSSGEVVISVVPV